MAPQTKRKSPENKPKKYRTVLSAVYAKCLDCSGGNRDEVTNCPVKTCPLYLIRNKSIYENTYARS